MPNTLPDLPSALIRFALADLALVEADPRYFVEMGDWHYPSAGTCEVCLAGAVMAKSLGTSPDTPHHPFDFEDPLANKLRALNFFHTGDLQAAFLVLDLPDPPFLGADITPYDHNPAQFRSDMADLATELMEHGL